MHASTTSFSFTARGGRFRVEEVHDLLTTAGYTVAVVQNPTVSLAADVAVTRRAIAVQNGPAILVGQSYGGAVITEAGSDPKIVGLVYVAGWVPDRGESVEVLVKKWSGNGATAPLRHRHDLAQTCPRSDAGRALTAPGARFLVRVGVDVDGAPRERRARAAVPRLEANAASILPEPRATAAAGGPVDARL